MHTSEIKNVLNSPLRYF